MKKHGRFEAPSAPRPSWKHMNVHLQMMVTSAVSMLLCCSMLLGTTMAWFTDTIVSGENQITVGTLGVKLLVDNQELTKDRTNTPIFGSDITWTPNKFVVRELTIENTGNIDLKYVLNFIMTADNPDVAKTFHVFVKEGPKGSADLTLADIKEWTCIGSLSEIFTKGLSIFSGDLNAGENPSRTYTVALCMDNTTNSDIQGASMKLNIKLNAYQSDISSEDIDAINLEESSGDSEEPGESQDSGEEAAEGEEEAVVENDEEAAEDGNEEVVEDEKEEVIEGEEAVGNEEGKDPEQEVSPNETDTPKSETPDGETSGEQTPEGENPGEQNPEGQSLEEQNPEGQSLEEQNPEGQNPDGETPAASGITDPDADTTGNAEPAGSDPAEQQ